MSVIKFYGFFLIFLMSLVLGKCDDPQTPIYDCNSNFEMDHVWMDDCEEQYCSVIRGETKNVTVYFSEDLYFNDMKIEASVWLFAQKFVIPSDPSSVCDHWKCPVTTSDKKNSQVISVTLDAVMPGTAKFQINATTDNNKAIAYCFYTFITLEP